MQCGVHGVSGVGPTRGCITTSVGDVGETPYLLPSLTVNHQQTHIMASESLFPVFNSKLDLRGQQFRQNETAWAPVLERFEAALGEVAAEGTDHSMRRHQSRGQLLGM